MRLRLEIYRSSPGAGARPYILQTTFPTRDLEDESLTVKDANLLGSVVVQKYT
jgi:UBX domain-containing protein 1